MRDMWHAHVVCQCINHSLPSHVHALHSIILIHQNTVIIFLPHFKDRKMVVRVTKFLTTHKLTLDHMMYTCTLAQTGLSKETAVNLNLHSRSHNEFTHSCTLSWQQHGTHHISDSAHEVLWVVSVGFNQFRLACINLWVSSSHPQTQTALDEWTASGLCFAVLQKAEIVMIQSYALTRSIIKVGSIAQHFFQKHKQWFNPNHLACWIWPTMGYSRKHPSHPINLIQQLI